MHHSTLWHHCRGRGQEAVEWNCNTAQRNTEHSAHTEMIWLFELFQTLHENFWFLYHIIYVVVTSVIVSVFFSLQRLIFHWIGLNLSWTSKKPKDHLQSLHHQIICNSLVTFLWLWCHMQFISSVDIITVLNLSFSICLIPVEPVFHWILEMLKSQLVMIWLVADNMMSSCSLWTKY